MDDAFLVDFGHLSDSLLNDTIDAMAYDEDLVYITFENNFGYTSLRADLKRRTELYLDSIGSDTTVNKDPNHVLGGMDIQTVFTVEGVVNVDDTLLFIKPDGTQYYVLNGDYDLLESIIDGTWTGNDMSNVEIHYADGSTSRSSCKATKSNSWLWHYKLIGSQWYAMRIKGGFYNIVWLNRWYSTTESFKRKSSGKFKGEKMNIGSGFDSYIYNNIFGDCGESGFNSNLSDAKKRTSYTHPSPDSPMFRIYNGGHNTSHATDKLPNTKWRYLTW